MSKYIGATVVNLSVDTVDVTGDITATDATPEVIIVNDTHEDTDGGREGKVTFKGQQSGGEETTLAEIQASHDGTSDDQKGDLIFKTNDGSDGASPTERLKIDSTGNVGVSGSTKTTALSSMAHFETLGLTVDDNTAYDNVGVGGGIAFRGKRNTSGTQTVFGAIDVGKESASNDSYTGSLRFYTNNNSTGVPTKHMNIDALGRITKPNQPAFLVGPASMQSDLPINGNSTVVWGTEVFDIGSNFASNVFTAPVTGKYQLNVKINFINVDVDYQYINVYLAASNRSMVNTFGAGAGDVDNYQTVAFSTLMDMDANDQAWVYVALPNQGAAITDVSTDSTFSGYLVA